MKLLIKLLFVMLSLILFGCLPTKPTITSGGQNVKIINKEPSAKCQYLTEVVSYYWSVDKNPGGIDVFDSKNAHEIVLKNNIAEIGGNTGVLVFNGDGVDGYLNFYAVYHCN